MSNSEQSTPDTVFLAAGAVDCDAVDGPQLLGSECRQCHHKWFPHAAICPTCLSQEIDTTPLSRVGSLYSYSVVHVAPKGWMVPYAVGYVDLPEGVRVFGHIAGVAFDELRVDMPVEVRIGPVGRDEEGREVVSYRFEPLG